MPTQSPPPVPPQPALAGADAALAGARVSRRWSTGKLLFVVLTIALAPLGAIAFGAATRTIGTSDVEREMLLQVAVNETAQRVTRLLDADSTRLIQTLQAVTRRQVRSEPSGIEMPDAAIVEPVAKSAEEKRADTIAAACTAAATEFPGGGDNPSAQIIGASTGSDLCTSGVPSLVEAAGLAPGKAVLDERNQRLIYALAPVGTDGMAVLVYPLTLFEHIIGESNRLPPHRVVLAGRTVQHVYSDTVGDVAQALLMQAEAPIGQTGLDLQLAASRSWLNGPEIIGLVTPLGMWLLAALLSWLVVDRLLLTPIQRLSRAMLRYQPGDTLAPQGHGLFAAGEVDGLQSSFERLTQSVAADRAALDASLDTQRALTREVHHRVKNNLQIIASLISLHSRDAQTPLETAAYRGIQRRVDALAVVHRHLHADIEDIEGIALGTMLGELSVGLRHGLSSEFGQVRVDVAVDTAQADQDVALPVAFLVTELIELACLCDPTAPIAIDLHRRSAQLATLSVRSTGLVSCADKAGKRFASYERVLSGLSRQLRQPLQIDEALGRYSIDVPVLPPAGFIPEPDSPS